MNIKEKEKRLKERIATVYIAMKNKKTPLVAKLFAIITVAYALSPIDLIPDFIPVIGYVDDLILLPLLAWISLKLIPEDIVLSAKEEAKEIWKDGKPNKWYYGIPIILFWLIIAVILVRKFILKI